MQIGVGMGRPGVSMPKVAVNTGEKIPCNFEAASEKRLSTASVRHFKVQGYKGMFLRLS